MEIKVISPKVYLYLDKRGLLSKWYKSVILFEANPRHPSLSTELMEPKEEFIYSFRVDKKYRALFVIKNNIAFVFRVTNHYR